MLPIVAPSLTNASMSSPLWKLPVIATVAEAKVALSRSDKAMPLSITTGVEAVLSPATNEALPLEAVTIGVWSVSATVTVRVAVLLVLAFASSAEKLIVRVAVFGVMAVSV